MYLKFFRLLFTPDYFFSPSVDFFLSFNFQSLFFQIHVDTKPSKALVKENESGNRLRRNKGK